MPLAQRLAELVQACFTGIWIESHEHDDALLEIASLCRQEQWRLLTWDIDQGLRVQAADQTQVVETGANDPLAAIRSLAALQSEGASSTLLVLVIPAVSRDCAGAAATIVQRQAEPHLRDHSLAGGADPGGVREADPGDRA